MALAVDEGVLASEAEFEKLCEDEYEACLLRLPEVLLSVARYWHEHAPSEAERRAAHERGTRAATDGQATAPPRRPFPALTPTPAPWFVSVTITKITFAPISIHRETIRSRPGTGIRVSPGASCGIDRFPRRPHMTTRTITRRVRGQPASDGAGVRLTRVIGQPALDMLDPFLLLDEFGSDQPGDYIAGFPEHPHRGFETVTYMLDGRMRHGDNQGNSRPAGIGQRAVDDRRARHRAFGDARAGRGPDARLPAVGQPAGQRQDDRAALPGHRARGDSRGRAGRGRRACAWSPARYGDTEGPVNGHRDAAAVPGHRAGAGTRASRCRSRPGHNAFAYVFEGQAWHVGAEPLGRGELAVLSDGDAVSLAAGEADARVLLVAGRPLREPVARYGPFVMNTRQEIIQAVEDFNAGRF